MNNRNGQVMLITVLVLSATTIAVSTIAGSLTINQIRQATNVSDSAKAIFAAETGIEWYRYQTFKNPSYVKPELRNNAIYNVITHPGQPTRSIGLAGGGVTAPNQVTRALEITGAAAVPLPPPPPPAPASAPAPVLNPVVCSPISSTAIPGQTFTFVASGGAPPFSWSAPSPVFPTSGTGYTFGPVFPVSGSYVISLTDGRTSAQGGITGAPPVSPPQGASLSASTTTNINPGGSVGYVANYSNFSSTPVSPPSSVLCGDSATLVAGSFRCGVSGNQCTFTCQNYQSSSRPSVVLSNTSGQGASCPLGPFITVSAPPPPPPPSSPATPSLTASSSCLSGAPRVSLSWTVSSTSGISEYHIERCTGSTCASFTQIATDSASPYEDANVVSGTTYRYRIWSHNHSNNLASAYSNSPIATPFCAVSLPPPPPSPPPPQSSSGCLAADGLLKPVNSLCVNAAGGYQTGACVAPYAYQERKTCASNGTWLSYDTQCLHRHCPSSGFCPNSTVSFDGFHFTNPSTEPLLSPNYPACP